MAEFNTNPGDRSVSELERDVDSERERVSATIDELQARASMGNIVDQVVKAVTENGGDVSRNLGRSLRDNPMAALLTGVGVAWLMAGSGGTARKESDWDSDDPRYRGGTEPDWRTFGVSRDSSAYGSQADPSGYGSQSDPTGFGQSDTSDFGSRRNASMTDDDPSSTGIGSRVSDATGKIGDKVSDAVHGLGERAAEFTHAAGDRVGQAGHAMRDAGVSARHRAGQARHSVAGAGRDVQEGLDRFMQDQPLVMGAIAMALGAAFGGAMPRSRTEDRMFGEQSDRAKEKVMTLAEDQGAKLQASASAVVEEAMDIADETAEELNSSLPSGQQIADTADAKMRDAAGRIREAAKTGSESSSDMPVK